MKTRQAFHGRFLTGISTETLIEAVTCPVFHTRATRMMLALMLAELAYRLRIGESHFHIRESHTVALGIWQSVFGERVPMPRGFGAPSEAWPHERTWAMQ